MAAEIGNHPIRKANLSDLDAAFDIVSKCDSWLSSQGINYWNDYYTKEKLAKAIKEESVYLIFHKGIPCGTVTVIETNPYSASDNKFWKDANAKALHLSCLGVLPKYQGIGLAGELLNFIEHYARENDFRYIRLDMFYDQSIPYYEKLANFYMGIGYRIVGERMGKRLPIPAKFFEKGLY